MLLNINAKPALRLSAIVLATFILVGCSSSPPLPGDASPTCTVSASEFATWFDAGSVSLNGVVDPANSLQTLNPNCDFYKWSERMFLWLTSPAPVSYGGGAHIFDSPVFFDVSLPDASGNRTLVPHTAGFLRPFALRAAQVGMHHLPVLLDNKGKVLEVEPSVFAADGKQLIMNEQGQQVEIGKATLGPDKVPVFIDNSGQVIKNAKPVIRKEFAENRRIVQKFIVDRVPIFIDGSGAVAPVEQGEADGNVLESQGGSLIYYATMVNDVYAYFLTGFKDGALTSPTPTQFPSTQGDLNQIKAFAATHGVATFPDSNALAIELKTSWVDASTIPSANLNNYITMQGSVPTYDTSNHNNWVQTGTKTITVALVGMHVVGSTAGHPEMVWATFEQISNTPNNTFTYINNSNAVTTSTLSTSGSWLFCASNASTPFNQPHMSVSNTGISSTGSFSISPSNIIRSKAWGAAENQAPNPIDASTAASNTEIIAINNAVTGMLPAGDVRRNYLFHGATWTEGGISASGSFSGTNGPSIAVGTSQLANTTMETFQQGPDNTFGSGMNCFDCHAGAMIAASASSFQISHIFGAIQPLF